jgi:hypothetical protein
MQWSMAMVIVGPTVLLPPLLLLGRLRTHQLSSPSNGAM